MSDASGGGVGLAATGPSLTMTAMGTPPLMMILNKYGRTRSAIQKGPNTEKTNSGTKLL
ncbi:hypothetical protein BDZ85DRAFT_270656 [Elsinoe ampelina]|uniref:Uncharacterized protein n=1 Tax=Elsinoe ampelina TaxID=302913 RepID=A0A6A6FYF6_9PEZI|nr:hypothetical protein BDZ85DRAFT_270656 [Elsinoe ampelina]